MGFVILGLMAGIPLGIGSFAFFYARGASYLTNDPAACVNCHVMRPQFEGWNRSSHHAVAVCNDCHAPHSLLGKYWTKAVNGFEHSLAFTTQRFHEPIQIKGRNLKVTEQACRTCHERLWEASGASSHALQETSCVKCHRSVGHAK